MKKYSRNTLLARCLMTGTVFITFLSGCAGTKINPDNETAPDSIAPFVDGSLQIDESAFIQVPIESSQLAVSSTNLPSQGKDNLVRPDAGGFWHVRVPKVETRPWITLDMKTGQILTVLGIIGRPDADQLWTGYRATLETSDDGVDWAVVAYLGIAPGLPKDKWIYFSIPENGRHRYYRFSIHDWKFMSVSRLAVYIRPGTYQPVPAVSGQKPLQIEGSREINLSAFEQVPLSASQIEVSSINNPTQGGDVLVQSGTDGFWHVKMPRQKEPEWVLVDLGSEQAVTLIRARPRSGYPNHFWYGYSAALDASNDKEHWTELALLGGLRSELTGDWLSFLVGNLQPYRYYRLSILDEGFLSMSRLELYTLRR
jgi:hypothetical protein